MRNKDFLVYCGSATQRVRWLADVALHKYQQQTKQDAGLVKGMRYENGQTIDVDQQIKAELNYDCQVWVILKEDLAVMEAEEARMLGQ